MTVTTTPPTRPIGPTVELGARPRLRAVLRWDLAVRFVLGLVGPMLLLAALGAGPEIGLAAGLAGGLGALASLGTEFRHRSALFTTLLAAPLAVALATLAAGHRSAAVGVVFGLFTIFGVMTKAGLTARMAWYPVASLGLLAALQPPSLPAWQAAALTLAGMAWAVALAYLVPLVLRAPRLPVAEQHGSFGAGLRRVTASGFRGAVFPLVLGAAAAGVVLAGTALSDGRPESAYWAAFALLALTQPTTARVRTAAVPTLLGAVVGAVLSAELVIAGLPISVLLLVVLVCAALGALFVIWSQFLRTMLFTPLSVAFAAIAGNVTLVAEIRAVDYVLGAAIALAAAALYEWFEHALPHRAGRDEAVRSSTGPLG